MADTKTQGRQVRGVFANYRRTVVAPDGSERVGLAMKTRGEYIGDDAAPGEIERLESLGMLMPEGGEIDDVRALEEAVTRALNPLDVIRETPTPTMSVSPPPLGATPLGEFTTGDTGIDPADQPDPLPTGTIVTTSPGVNAEQEALDAQRAGTNLPRTDAPDPEDTGALAEFIANEKLNAGDTVALAEGDPDRAALVLEAERNATGGDPRKTVEEPLQKIIDQGDGGQ